MESSESCPTTDFLICVDYSNYPTSNSMIEILDRNTPLLFLKVDQKSQFRRAFCSTVKTSNG